MFGVGEEIPTEGVELSEFTGEEFGVNEALGHEHVLADDSVFGNHHSDGPI
jgi:hypothetical protein